LISGVTNLFFVSAMSSIHTFLASPDVNQFKKKAKTHLPPIKCLPLKNFTKGFGAVKLTSTSGMKFAPGPEDGGPSSIFHDEGASTEVTGTVVSSRALMTAGKGSRTSPEKEKPLEYVKMGE
jgi:hypothetical protein